MIIYIFIQSFIILIKGSANLVKDLTKKIHLGALGEKEQDNALQEAKLLRNFNHPNIVKYINSFIDYDMLVIILEYCEGFFQIHYIKQIEGDLAFHIKRKQQKKSSYFPEKLILNWFLQIILAVKYIHERKILHRDIKTSNIFLTSNGTIKIGDFGISKLLENSNDKANTVVGTPYYMSPEACESKPYTYKSDMWSIGCVLYELCSLKHAFDSSNLLNLLYKIIKEREDPIPDIYSQELQDLIHCLLSKLQEDRPNIKDLFYQSFIQKTMQEFVLSKGILQNDEKFPIKPTQTHQQYNNKKSSTCQKNQTTKTSNKFFTNNKQIKNKSIEATKQLYDYKSQNNNENNEENDNSQSLDLNTINSQQFSRIMGRQQQENDYNLNQQQKQKTQYIQLFDNPLQKQQTFPIKEKEDDYEDDFEEYEDENEYANNNTSKRLTMQASGQELLQVIDIYKEQLNESYNSDDIKKDFQELQLKNNLQQQQAFDINDNQAQILNMKKECISKLGYTLFEKIYQLLKYHRKKNTSNNIIHQELIKLVNNEELNYCFVVDQLIFLENQ